MDPVSEPPVPDAQPEQSKGRLGFGPLAAGVGMSVLIHGALVAGALALGGGAEAGSGGRVADAPTRFVPFVEARFVKLGQRLEERQLPNRFTPQRSTSPLQAGTAVSKAPRANRPDAGPQPANAMQDLLTRLGNRAEVLSQIGQAHDQEGDPEGIEEGTETRANGNIYLGRLYSFFQRGLTMPSSIPDDQRSSLRCNVAVEITVDGRIGSYRIIRPSGNDDYDQAVRLRMEQAVGAAIPPPPEEIADQFLGRTLPIGITPPR